MKEIVIFTDGSSLGNPGPGGWGSIVYNKDKNIVTELGGYDPKTTNNRMEMTAVAEAISFVVSKQLEEDTVITIHTDSQYVINGMTKWVFGWENSGWMTMNKKPVLNKDLWQLLVLKSKDLEILWKYVEGHSGIAGNERVDDIATSFASNKDIVLFSGSKDDYKIDLENIVAIYGKQKSGKVYSYLSMIDGEIKSHKTWKECEDRVKGKKARFKKTFSKKDEENIIKSWLS